MSDRSGMAIPPPRGVKCQFCQRISAIEFGMILRCHWCDRPGFFIRGLPEPQPNDWPQGLVELNLDGGLFTILATEWDTHGESHAGTCEDFRP